MQVQQAQDSICSEDVMLWPDETWCYRCELPEMDHMSDDYETIPFDTDRWHELVGTTPMDLARARGYGFLAFSMEGKRRQLDTLKSARGFYLGTVTDEGAPNTRESEAYWSTREEATAAMTSGNWTQRREV